ncbi:hypothetical protein HPP92_015758 [Vanilla planifolia]|uniref:Uncharacterized protein n=1 Tax=Vanilla planifolia TaxID=51239 RepID=A0A835QIH9_VANPL|nr:hypothetical protein HPP92_015758 [Vanilla planifolia]
MESKEDSETMEGGETRKPKNSTVEMNMGLGCCSKAIKGGELEESWMVKQQRDRNLWKVGIKVVEETKCSAIAIGATDFQPLGRSNKLRSSDFQISIWKANLNSRKKGPGVAKKEWEGSKNGKGNWQFTRMSSSGEAGKRRLPWNVEKIALGTLVLCIPERERWLGYLKMNPSVEASGGGKLCEMGNFRNGEVLGSRNLGVEASRIEKLQKLGSFKKKASEKKIEKQREKELCLGRGIPTSVSGPLQGQVESKIV